jgi:DNA polymerase-3 subunit delta'
MRLPLTITDIASAFKAAQTLVDVATTEASAITEVRDESEQEKLAQAWGQGETGRGMASGGSKAIKELEKEQKSRATRFVRDTIDGALLDLATLYRDVMMVQSGVTDSLINSDLTDDIARLAAKIPPAATITKINAIMSARTNLSHNAAPLLTLEALFCSLA